MARAFRPENPRMGSLFQPEPCLNSKDFRLKVVAPPDGYTGFFDKIVLAEKLREVRALIGFTRLGVSRRFRHAAGIAARSTCALVPADPNLGSRIGNRGEGIFFQFSEKALKKWEGNHGAYYDEFFKAHRRWREARKLEPDVGYPGIRFVLLHTFAHAVIRQLSIECGYTTASLRERIYCNSPEDDEPMAGVLIYTAAPDSEGTLGGLCALGRPDRLGSHLDACPGHDAALCFRSAVCRTSPVIGGDHVAWGRLPCLHVPARNILRTREQIPGSFRVGGDRWTEPIWHSLSDGNGNGRNKTFRDGD